MHITLCIIIHNPIKTHIFMLPVFLSFLILHPPPPVPNQIGGGGKISFASPQKDQIESTFTKKNEII